MKTLKGMMLVATAVMVAPLAASAVEVTSPVYNADLVANTPYTYSFDLEQGGFQDFNFTALEAFKIGGFSISGSGNNDGTDLANVTFDFVRPSNNGFSNIIPNPAGSGDALAYDFLDGLTVAAGDMWSILFDDGLEDDVSVTLSFNTQAVAPVPVPAAGLLLGGTILGGAIAARRKKKKADA